MSGACGQHSNRRRRRHLASPAGRFHRQCTEAEISLILRGIRQEYSRSQARPLAKNEKKGGLLPGIQRLRQPVQVLLSSVCSVQENPLKRHRGGLSRIEI